MGIEKSQAPPNKQPAPAAVNCVHFFSLLKTDAALLKAR